MIQFGLSAPYGCGFFMISSVPILIYVNGKPSGQNRRKSSLQGVHF